MITDTMGYEAKEKALIFNPHSNIAGTPNKNIRNIKENIPNMSINTALTNKFVSTSASTALSASGCSSLGFSMFPFDLDYQHGMRIKVYDTKSDDYVNKALDSGSKMVENKMKAFFSDSGGSSTKASSASSASKQANAVSAKGNNSSSNPLGINGGVWPSLPPDMGNPRLAKILVDTFYLPIPNSISETISNNYNEQPGWIDDLAKYAGKLPVVGKGIDKTVGAVKGVVGALTPYAKFTGTRSVSYYENKIQMFNSQNFREITLSWDFIPNNQSEAIVLQNMVKMIKAYGTPDTMAGKLLVKEPHFFGLRFNNFVLDNALRFDEVVLVTASIDYVPGGTMELYNDGQPKHIQLNMTFKDRMPKLMRDWCSPIPGDGTPGSEPKCG